MAESTIIMSKQANKLDGSLRAKAYSFLAKLTENDETSGLHIEKVKNCRDDRVRTGRVDQQYRAVLFKIAESGHNHYVVEGIYNHDEAYKVAPYIKLATNPVNGIPEVTPATPSNDASASASGSHTDSTHPTTALAQHNASAVITADRAELLSLGLDANLVDKALALTSDDAVLDLAASLTGWQEAALVGLASGMTPDQVREELFEPSEEPGTQQAPTPHTGEARESDAELLSSLRSPAAAMEFATIDGTEELRRVIEDGDFGAWRLFLHPTQRRYVNGRWNGPFRLGGGAGTGKTVVILHRAASLARENPQARVVITTFTRNLAQELSASLKSLDPNIPRATELGQPGVYITGIDALASAIITSAGPDDAAQATEDVLGTSRTNLRSGRTSQKLWRDVLTQTSDVPEHVAHQQLLEAEYEQVILPKRIRTRQEYLRTRRPGRKFRLNRRDRDAVWNLVEAYRQDSRITDTISFAEASAIAAQNLSSHSPLADHVLVDEGQDLSPTHWMLIRSLASEGPNDIFIAEDPHQRIYGHRLVLSQYGIMTRGRSRNLTLNYRTTAQILNWSTTVLKGGSYTGLDGANDDKLAGYRSARRGPEVTVHECETLTEEFDFLAETTQTWMNNSSSGPTAILVRDKAQQKLVVSALQDHKVKARAVERDLAPSGVPVVMTMHRAKGTEFSKVFLFGISSQSIPMGIKAYAFDEDEMEQALLRERSLLYVAASRARDELVVSWHSQPSPLLDTATSQPAKS